MNEETILFRGSSSPVINLGAFLLSLLVLVATIVAGFFFNQPLIGIASLPVLGFMLVKWLLIRCRVYEITSERVKVREGILTKKTEELELYRVQDMALIEPLIARLFGTGTIVLTTMDASHPNLQIEYIRGAAKISDQLRKAVETARERKRVRLAELE